jgi:hypothetical protein
MNKLGDGPGSRMDNAGFIVRALTACIAAGTLDIVYACAVSALHGRMPTTVLQSVASGWMGASAYSGGLPTALLGLFTHYAIMLIMAATYGVAASLVPALRRQPSLKGPIYGLGLYAVMYGVVLPLRFPAIFPRLNGWVTATDIVVHMGVGLIIALLFSQTRERVSPAR